MDQKAKAKAAWQRSYEVVSYILGSNGNFFVIFLESFRMVCTLAAGLRVNQRQQKQSA